MVEREITVSNRLGLHARAAAKLVQLAGRFPARVSLVCRGREVNAQSILGVMMLAAGKGVSLVVRAVGEDEQAALEAVIDLFDRKFDEPD
ncbi:MAG: HPr family phosphocarrier protein [Xanthomonadales bacterium]|nr:Phosphocarrier protein HPr [Xanthomonadales bacterium]MCC6593237.1 HPr family phosphocarrier protein [Xanthomonadales bacterium]MCE7929856.1 HPr family phosphocarrier protein [Xanthomonadales bacterium PRO6]